MPATKSQVLGALTGAIVVLLAGFFIGVSFQGEWTLTSAFLAAFVALLMIVFAFSAWQQVEDGQPMPEAQRRFLALYLISICVGLIYLVFALMAVRFPDLEAVTLPTAPTLPENARPADGAVAIAHVVPNPIRADLIPLDLQIFGYNFTAATATPTPGAGAPPSGSGTQVPESTSSETGAGRGKSADGPGRGTSNVPQPTTPSPLSPAPGAGPLVVFRGNTSKTPKFVSDHLLIVSLTAEDASVAGLAPITVVGRNGKTASTQVRVLDLTGELHVLGWRPLITREMQLLMLVVVAGALGSYVHAIRSLTAYIGNQQAVASWFWFYITKPFLGVALSLVFYTAIRGGFVAGSPADVKSVNPFGVFAIAALVGMFADKAGNKLAEIFDALFRSASERQNPISSLAIATASLPQATANAPYTATIDVTGGTKPHTFSLINPPAWLQIDPATGVLSGKPPAAKDETVEVSVADAKTSRTSKKMALKVT